MKGNRPSIASPIISVLRRYETGESWSLSGQPVYPIKKIQAQKTEQSIKVLPTAKNGAGNVRKP